VDDPALLVMADKLFRNGLAGTRILRWIDAMMAQARLEDYG
jgi:hypothetical protein